MVMVISNPIWRRFLKAIKREDLAQDPRFMDDMARYENRDVLNSIVGEWVSQRTVNEAVNLLEEARIPCGKVNNIADIIDDPHIRAREMLVEVDFPGVGLVPLSGVVPKLSQTPGKIERRAPLIGEHNEEIYRGLLGFKKEEFEKLKKEGVI